MLLPLRILLLLISVCAVAALPSRVFAGGGAENVLLVINRASDSSKLIANHYISLRDIPARNVVYLDNIPDQQRISYDEFSERILAPIVAVLQERKLEASIDYIVYSADFPTTVTVRRERQKFIEAAQGSPGGIVGASNSKLFNPEASISSLTYFTPALHNGDYSFFAIDSNRYMRAHNRLLLVAPFYGEEQNRFTDTLDDVRAKKYDEAIPVLLDFAREHPNQIGVSYWLARCYAYKNDAAEATNWLNRAIGGGWAYRDYTRSDLAFETVQSDEAFKAAVARMENQKFEFLPTHGFRSSYRWGLNGMINGTVEQGSTHYLSTVLAVTRNKGMTEQEALEHIKMCVEADETRPQGTVYFCDSQDVRTKTRVAMFPGAIEELEQIGVSGEVIKGHFPKNKHDIIGLTMGRAQFDVPSFNCSITPGAICENLTSYGGILQPGPRSQTVCTEFLRYGAAGSCGTVVEPFAVPQKFPHARIHVQYIKGCSLAESFYQSVHGPFQLLIVGDALCQPWAVRPSFTTSGIDEGAVVSGKVDLAFDFSASPVQVAGVEVFLDGQLIQRIRKPQQISFDSAKFSDGFHELRLVAVAANSIETQGRQVIRFSVANSTDTVTMSCEQEELDWNESVLLNVSTNCGEKIELIQNHEVIASGEQSEVIFKVSGRKLGRGPVTLRAVVSKDGGQISSAPLKLFVNGPIANTKTETIELKR